MMMLIYCVSATCLLIWNVVIWFREEQDVHLDEFFITIVLSLTPIINTILIIAGCVVYTLIFIKGTGVLNTVIFKGKKNE